MSRQKSWKQIKGQRHRFRADVGRRGKKRAFRGPDIDTVLLKNIQCLTAQCEAVDHLWLTVGKWAGGIKEGDQIEFNARVGWYKKGYQGRRAWETGEAWEEWDLRLERPTQIKHGNVRT